jgi:hypothetical protein
LEKYFVSNTKIDIVNFLTRNTIYLKDMNGNVYLNYGNVRSGQGYSGKGLGPDVGININGVSYKYDFGTYQCIGGGDLTVSKKNIWGHELAHLFLGGNNFHTSGGNHVGTDETNTFIGIQGGYGLFNGGLISCNGFERWRLGWQFDINNINMISSNNQNSDIISKFTGEQTFTMRDFVTYGDVIRIKLPYKDSENASNQYIWLENHQCGKNGKFDGYVYNDIKPCRSVDKAGVYSYYQVGKDIIESTIPKQVYPDNEKDNLRIISAEGNYNVNFLGYTEDCLNFCGGSCRPLFEYTTPNSFHGVNPQTEVISPDLSKSTLDYKSTHKYMGSKIKNGIPYNNLPSCGSDLDAFIPTQTGILMDLSSNPAAVNTTTYYSVQYKHQNYITQTTIWDFYSVDNYRNTKKIYLSGLSIKMIDPDPANTGMKAYTVKVRWDDYDIKQNVNWAGDIVSKEQINLLQGKTISLEQNLTPCQIEKDPVSGVFAPPTRLTCEPNSILTMNEYSKIVLKEKSSIILQSSSSNTIKDGAIIEIQNGSTLQIKSGANLNILGSGKIVVKSGGYICVESGATINLQDYNSLIVLEEGASYGANPLLFTSPSCSSTITKTGNGAIADFNQDVYIQNRTISTSQYFGGKNIYVGNHVTTSQTGDVIINNNANVIFDCKTTTFDCGFECVVGSTYEVKNH